MKYQGLVLDFDTVPAAIPVLRRVRDTTNVSSNGMAVKTPVPLTLVQTMDIALLLPQGGTVLATGIVIWDDKHGKCGLKVQCSGPEMRKKLDSWLDSQFAVMK